MNTHDILDEYKRHLALAVLDCADMQTIRQKSIANLDRWNANDTWCSAHDEWRKLMTTGSDAEIIAAMTGKDQTANRLRQSPPYAGILDEKTRMHLWEIRASLT